MSLAEISPSNLSLLYREEGSQSQSENQNPTLEDLFNDAVVRSTDPESNKLDRKQVLNAAFDTISNNIDPHADSADKAYSMSYLLEMFKDRGIVRGEIEVHRSEMIAPEGDVEGHFWVRYTSYDGKPIIADPEKGILGLLSDLRSENLDWTYLNDAEKMDRAPEDAALLLDGLIGIEEIPEDPGTSYVSMNLVLGTIAVGS